MGAEEISDNSEQLTAGEVLRAIIELYGVLEAQQILEHIRAKKAAENLPITDQTASPEEREEEG